VVFRKYFRGKHFLILTVITGLPGSNQKNNKQPDRHDQASGVKVMKQGDDK